MEFNCAQRVHLNYLEAFPGVAINLLVGGLFYPKTLAGLGIAFMIGRAGYGRGYTAQGPGKNLYRKVMVEGRLLGSAVGFLSYAGMVGTVIYSAVRLLGWIA